MRNRDRGKLLPFDPEIERTIRARRKALLIFDNPTFEMTDPTDPTNNLEVANNVLPEGQGEVNPPPHNRRTLLDITRSNSIDHCYEVRRLTVEVKIFELKLGLIRMVQQHPFGGTELEDPNNHLMKYFAAHRHNQERWD